MKKTYFDIHPSALFQLGSTLITDEAQALLELVKNSYDADSSYCKITINTKRALGGNFEHAEDIGYILIEDAGVGMNEDDLIAGWLTISNRIKAEIKKQGEAIGKYKRTPLGDKGLGRLGAQKLGQKLEIVSRPRGSNDEYQIAFSWRIFKDPNIKRLGQVPLYIKKRPAQQAPGTSIAITSLNNPDYWVQNDEDSDLVRKFIPLISPYKQPNKFRVMLNVNAKPIEFEALSERIRDVSQILYSINFDGQTLQVNGLMKLELLNTQQDLALYKELAEKDQGARFLEFLLQQKKSKDINLGASKAKGWFVECSYKVPLENIDKVNKLLVMDNQALANPGPFEGEVQYHDLGTDNTPNVFGKKSAYKEYIKKHIGVRIFRDGFAVRMPEDWLGLGRQWTSASSYYGLKPGNTIGYISISVKDNASLEEKTDREGFIENPAYQTFSQLMRKFIEFTKKAQDHIRREWNKFKQQHEQVEAADAVAPKPEEVANTLHKALTEAAPLGLSLESSLKDLSQVTATYTNLVESLTETHGNKSPEVIQKQKEAEQTIERVQNVAESLRGFLKRLEQHRDLSKTLVYQIQDLQEQMNDLYTMVSLGLTAEALSHEISNISDQLAERTQSILRYFRSQNIKDVALITYLEHVNTSVAGLRKQLSHLAPSLRYVRERRERFYVEPFVEGLCEFYRDRLERSRITTQVQMVKAAEFELKINRGKLTQIFDNLFLNSEYWLREDIRLEYIKEGLISIQIEEPFIRFYDNGRGIDPVVEETLFEPFITTKEKGRGRGLGLFIIRELLDVDGCSIDLLPERNKFKRKYIFQLNLTGALPNG